MNSNSQPARSTGLEHYKPGQNAFTVIPPQGTKVVTRTPRKKVVMTKAKQAARALETREERLERHSREKLALDQKGRPRVDLAPRTAGAITIRNKADAAKTARIQKGRSI